MVRLKFYGSEVSATDDYSLEIRHNQFNEIYISIDDETREVPAFLSLEKSTAIKLVKVLKTEISKIQ